MNVLLVSNQRPNEQGVGNPIMYRMRDALSRDERIEKVAFLPFCNSLSSLWSIRQKARDYDIVHVHFGGLYALVIWLGLLGIKCKKIITFHGTDIHAKALKTTTSKIKRLKIMVNQLASFINIRLFDKCGFVAKEMMDYIPNCLNRYMKEKSFLQTLGVDYTLFSFIDKLEAQKYLGLGPFRYVLFSDVSNTSIKRRDIAEDIVRFLGSDYTLLIMCGVKPNDVPYYINACDFLLLTSDEEGSPNIIREALSLNKPVFSVNVGDVAKQLSGLKNSAIIGRSPEVAVKVIKETVKYPYVDNTRMARKQILDFVSVSRGVVDLYEKVVFEN